MEIYLMQHGDYLTKEQDSEESLCPEGIEKMKKIEQALKRISIHVNQIITSPKKRARQTAEIVAYSVGSSPDKIIETPLLKPLTPPGETIEYLSQFSHLNSLLLVGHLPSLARIASSLLMNGSQEVIHFERGGIVRIDLDTFPTHAGQLRWYLTPELLGLICPERE
jgi:phosphohistidine phosphatase